MHITKFNKPYLNSVASLLGFTFSISPEYGIQSGNTWRKLYIVDSMDVQLGYMLYKDDKLYNIKRYSGSFQRDINEADYIFSNLDMLTSAGTFISKSKFIEVHKAAITKQKEDLEVKILWRKRNPLQNSKNKRKKLQGRDVRYVICILLNELIADKTK